jgi:hypothetical protein
MLKRRMDCGIKSGNDAEDYQRLMLERGSAASTWSIRMKRIVLLGIAMAASVALSAASVHGKPFVTHRWHGYGFLPGYHQPPNNAAPVYGVNRSAPAYTPGYWYDGTHYYFGRPGFYRGQYNGGSFGPCWTVTPIGRVWNCG